MRAKSGRDSYSGPFSTGQEHILATTFHLAGGSGVGGKNRGEKLGFYPEHGSRREKGVSLAKGGQEAGKS